MRSGIKKLRDILLATFFAAASVFSSGVVANANGCALTGGSGTQADPYQIASTGDFLTIPSCSTSRYYFELINDLDFTDVSYTAFDFNGLLLGNNKSISNISPNDQGVTNNGLFSQLLPSSKVIDLVIREPEVYADINAGALAGYADASWIENVIVLDGVVSGNEKAGGLVGHVERTVIQNVATAGTTVLADLYTGGVFGQLDANDTIEIGSMFSDSVDLFPLCQDGASSFAGTVAGRLTFNQDLEFYDFGSDNNYLNADSFVAPSECSIGGLFGLTVADHQLSDGEITLEIRRGFVANAELDYPDDFDASLLIGKVKTTQPDANVHVKVVESYVSTSFKNAPLADINDRIVTSFDNTVNGRVSATEYIFTELPFRLAEPHGVLTPATLQGASFIEDYDLFSRPEFFADQGMFTAQGLDVDELNQTVFSNWFMAPVYGQYSPVSIWLWEMGWINPSANFDLGIDFTTGAIEGDRSSQPAFTAAGDSWVNVPEEARAYFDGFTDYNPYFRSYFDDEPFVYVPAEVRCNNGIQEIASGAYPAGYFLPVVFDNWTYERQQNCYQNDQPYRFGGLTQEELGFDLGFDLPIGNESTRFVFPDSNGNLNFAPGYTMSAGNAFRALVTEQPAIIALGLDLEHVGAASSFWAARTEIAGQKAAVFSWENYGLFPAGSEHPAASASFQIVIVQTQDTVEIWYNYDSLATGAGSYGYRGPQLLLDPASGPTVGTNVWNIGGQPKVLDGCHPVTKLDWRAPDGLSQFTDPDLATAWNGAIYADFGLENPSEIALYSDDTCSTPVISSALQDESSDGKVLLEIRATGDQTVRTAPIGYTWIANDASDFEMLELNQNASINDLADGGSSQLRSASLNTEVAGRLVISFADPNRPALSSPAAYVGPLITSGQVQAAAGQQVVLEGRNLESISQVEISGTEAEFLVNGTQLILTIPDSAEPGLADVVLESSFGRLKVQNILVVLERDIASRAGVVASVKRVGDRVRIFATDIVGAGKVQFFVNGKEIAWVRATDTSNPKLRFANNRHYLVRTIDLAEGKNAIEIFVDGERVRRVAYTR